MNREAAIKEPSQWDPVTASTSSQVPGLRPLTDVSQVMHPTGMGVTTQMNIVSSVQTSQLNYMSSFVPSQIPLSSQNEMGELGLLSPGNMRTSDSPVCKPSDVSTSQGTSQAMQLPRVPQPIHPYGGVKVSLPAHSPDGPVPQMNLQSMNVSQPSQIQSSDVHVSPTQSQQMQSLQDQQSQPNQISTLSLSHPSLPSQVNTIPNSPMPISSAPMSPLPISTAPLSPMPISSTPMSPMPTPLSPMPQTPHHMPCGLRPSPGSMSPEGSVDLPPEMAAQGWRKFWSRRENRPYFWNKQTNESLWEWPPPSRPVGEIITGRGK